MPVSSSSATQLNSLDRPQAFHYDGLDGRALDFGAALSSTLAPARIHFRFSSSDERGGLNMARREVARLPRGLATPLQIQTLAG